MADIPWLAKLFSEYPVKAKDGRAIRTPDQVRNLREAFEGYDDAVMLDAVRRYMLVGSFFPSISDMWPHVQAAQEAARGVQWGKGAHKYSDDELYQMELEAGTMPPLDVVEARDYWGIVARAVVGDWEAEKVPA